MNVFFGFWFVCFTSHAARDFFRAYGTFSFFFFLLGLWVFDVGYKKQTKKGACLSHKGQSARRPDETKSKHRLSVLRFYQSGRMRLLSKLWCCSELISRRLQAHAWLIDGVRGAVAKFVCRCCKTVKR